MCPEWFIELACWASAAMLQTGVTLQQAAAADFLRGVCRLSSNCTVKDSCLISIKPSRRIQGLFSSMLDLIFNNQDLGVQICLTSAKVYLHIRLFLCIFYLFFLHVCISGQECWMSSDTSQGLFLQIPIGALNHNNKKQVLNIHLMTTAGLPNIAVPALATRAWLHVYSCEQNTLGSPQVKLIELDWSLKQVQQIHDTVLLSGWA